MPAGQGGDEQLVPSRRDDADCTEVCCDCPFAAYRFNCRVGSTRYVGAALHGAGGLIVSEERARKWLLFCRARGLKVRLYTRLRNEDTVAETRFVDVDAVAVEVEP